MKWYWWLIIALAWTLIPALYLIRAAWDCRKLDTTEPEMTEFNSREEND